MVYNSQVELAGRTLGRVSPTTQIEQVDTFGPESYTLVGGEKIAMAQPVNPYVAGAPMQGEKGCFGRQDTLDWATRGLRNPANNSLVLFGQRRIGKTTLLLQLQRTLPTDVFLPASPITVLRPRGPKIPRPFSS